VRFRCCLPRFDLHPGQIHLARGPAILQTILGSCVSVTFWCAEQGAGAMCHGVLPRYPGKTAGCAEHNGYRYVDYSVRRLAEKFDAIGADRRELEIKVFGGADVLPISCVGRGRLSIGAMNCEAAMDVLHEQGLTVIASDLRGVSGRKIVFHTGTGEVLVRRLVM